MRELHGGLSAPEPLNQRSSVSIEVSSRKLSSRCGETPTRNMSYHNKEYLEHIPCPLALHAARYRDALRLPFHIEAAFLEHDYQSLSCRRLPRYPFPAPVGGECGYANFEPAFIQKRNERERQRVRCVNEGYARLREHLPREFEDKRLSKVETLRAAIDYIKHLQCLLDLNVSGGEMELGEARRRRTQSSSDGESKTSLSDGGEAVY